MFLIEYSSLKPRLICRIAVFAVLILFVLTVTSCGKREVQSDKVTNVRITVTADETVILYDVEVAVRKDDPTVIDAFIQAIEDDDGLPPVRYDDEKNPTTVLDIGEFIDLPDKFWVFRINDKLFSETYGVESENPIHEGDRIYFEYVSYVWS